MDEASGEDGEDETGYELEQDAVKPEVEGEGVDVEAVQAPVVNHHPVFSVTGARLSVQPLP